MRTNLSLIVLVICMLACTSNIIYTEMYSIDSEGWSKDDVKTFEVPINNNEVRRDIFILLRNDNSYPYSNIFLIMNITDPSGSQSVDTLQYEMAKSSGEWLGSGIGNVKESKLLYKQSMRFDLKGTYQMNLSQAMRNNGSITGVERLPGITDIGISVQIPKDTIR